MGIRSKFVIQTGVGEGDPIDILDTNDIKISYACIVTGTVTYTVQHSLADQEFMDNDDNKGNTVTADGNYIFPVQQVRVNVTAGTGSVKFIVRQLVV